MLVVNGELSVGYDKINHTDDNTNDDNDNSSSP